MNARYVIEQEVLDVFLQLPVRRREKLLSVLAQLADHPQADDPVSHRDETGRLIRQQTISGLTVWYWLDGAVDEVRVLDIEAPRSRR